MIKFTHNIPKLGSATAGMSTYYNDDEIDKILTEVRNSLLSMKHDDKIIIEKDDG